MADRSKGFEVEVWEFEGANGLSFGRLEDFVAASLLEAGDPNKGGDNVAEALTACAIEGAPKGW